MSNPVDKPAHYTWHPSGIECRMISGDFPHHLGSAIEYIWRSHHKGSLEEDLRKAIKHIEFEIERYKRSPALLPRKPVRLEEDD